MYIRQLLYVQSINFIYLYAVFFFNKLRICGMFTNQSTKSTFTESKFRQKDTVYSWMKSKSTFYCEIIKERGGIGQGITSLKSYENPQFFLSNITYV